MTDCSTTKMWPKWYCAAQCLIFKVTGSFHLLPVGTHIWEPLSLNLYAILRRGQWHPLQYCSLENPWLEEPGRLQSMGSVRVGHDWVTSFSLFTFMHWRRKWQPTPMFLPGESQGRGSLVGCCLWGCTESDTTEATQQQQQQWEVRAFLVAHLVKNLPAMWETWVRFLGWEDPLEKGKASHSSILAWRIPWTYSLWGCKELDTTKQLALSLFTFSEE